MKPDDLFAEFQAGFEGRKFSAGLLVAIIDFLIELGIPDNRISSYEDLIKCFPRQTRTSAGRPANTLIVMRPDKSTLSLRGFYNEIERQYHATHKRFDYPFAAPHATQAWPDYIHWIDALVGYSERSWESFESA